MLTEIYQVTGIGPTFFGRNGGGDPYYTDGEITLGTLSPEAAPSTTPPTRLPDPPIVAAKDAIWARGETLLRGEQ